MQSLLPAPASRPPRRWGGGAGCTAPHAYSVNLTFLMLYLDNEFGLYTQKGTKGLRWSFGMATPYLSRNLRLGVKGRNLGAPGSVDGKSEAGGALLPPAALALPALPPLQLSQALPPLHLRQAAPCALPPVFHNVATTKSGTGLLPVGVLMA